MLDAERALAAAGSRAGVVPADESAAIAQACAADDYDWEELLQEGRLVGNPAEPLVRALGARVGEETARWVHLGATSQDIMDTAAMLVTRGRPRSRARRALARHERLRNPGPRAS